MGWNAQQTLRALGQLQQVDLGLLTFKELVSAAGGSPNPPKSTKPFSKTTSDTSGDIGFAKGGSIRGKNIALVGEQGRELIIDGVVIPNHLTNELLSLGLTADQMLAVGGVLDGGSTSDTTFVDDSDFDPLDTGQKSLLGLTGSSTSGGGGAGGGGTTSSTGGGGGGGGVTVLETKDSQVAAQTIIESAVESVTPVIAQSTVAAIQTQAQIQLQANARLANDFEKSLSKTMNELIDRVDTLISINEDIAPQVNDQIVKLNE